MQDVVRELGLMGTKEKYVHETFVYLDEIGAYIFKWKTGGNPELYQSDFVYNAVNK